MSRQAVTELADLEPTEHKHAVEALLADGPKAKSTPDRTTSTINLPSAPKELAKAVVDKLGRDCASWCIRHLARLSAKPLRRNAGSGGDAIGPSPRR